MTPDVPGESVRASMAAFYKSSDSYAQQQSSHGTDYFSRLLAVMDMVLVQRGLEILEIGAGAAGAMQEFLSGRQDVKGIALELSPASLNSAKDGSDARLRAVAGNALELPFRDRSIDAVVAFEVIEHLPNVAQALDEIVRVLRRPGHIIIGLPNHASLWTPLEDRLRGRSRLAFGVERGRGAGRWWRRNAALAFRKRLLRDVRFLYREPILGAAKGGDADAVYYAAPVDLLRFFEKRGARLVMSSAQERWGWLGGLLPVELQGSTVLAWQVTDAIDRG